jgi:hypothetical protein
MHIPVRWQFLQLPLVKPSPDRGRQSFAATHVSTWLMARGHVPRTQKELFQKITVWGWNLWFDLSNKLLVLSVPLLFDPATNITIWASRCDAAEKTLLTLENCGEPGSLRSTGFSRSIGKTDNTQRMRLRASAIRRAKVPVVRTIVLRGSHTGEPAVMSTLKMEKPRLSGFSDGQSLASQGSPAKPGPRDVKLRFAAGPGRTWALLAGSEAPDSLYKASHVRRWLPF